MDHQITLRECVTDADIARFWEEKDKMLLRDIVPGGDQMARHGMPHGAEADESYLHEFSSGFMSGDHSSETRTEPRPSISPRTARAGPTGAISRAPVVIT